MEIHKVLIVGASGGLGKALAVIFESNGWKVEALNRDTCNLADQESVKKLTQNTDFVNSGFSLCIISAATSEAGFLDELDVQAFRRCLEVNFHSPITLFSALAKADFPCQRFVFIHSGMADLFIPGFSPYSLSKRAFKDFLSHMSLENSFAKCKILEVWPGGMKTEFTKRIKIHGNFQIPVILKPRSPDEVAEKIFQAIKNNQKHLVLSPLACILGKVQSVLPSFMRLLVRLHPKLKTKY